MPGRMTAVHCTDIPTGNTGLDHLSDFPGDIIRQHERLGFEYTHRYHGRATRGLYRVHPEMVATKTLYVFINQIMNPKSQLRKPPPIRL